MKKDLALALILVCACPLQAQKVWSSSAGTIAFSKVGFADWTLAANQDRISDSVWITRASSQALINIKKESVYQTGSPVGTEWALGTTATYATLSYKSFIALSNNSPSSLIGKDLVLHLVAEKIYLDIQLTAYGSGSTGANFSYTRAKPTVNVSPERKNRVLTFGLLQNYPNPFNPTTEIRYHITVRGHVSVRVYDVLGSEVAALVDEVQGPGSHAIVFDGTRLSSGMYVVRLRSDDNVQMMKMVLLK